MTMETSCIMFVFMYTWLYESVLEQKACNWLRWCNYAPIITPSHKLFELENIHDVSSF